MFKSFKGLLIAFFLFWSISMPFLSHGQSFNFASHERSEKKTAAQLKAHGFPDTITVRGDAWLDIQTSPTTWRGKMKMKSVNDFIKFYVDHAYPRRVAFPYTYRLCYRLIGYRDSTSFTSFPVDTLTLGYQPDSLSPYQDLSLKRYGNFQKIVLVLTDMFRYEAGVHFPVDIDTITALNFAVEGSILTQPYVLKYGSSLYYGDAGSPSTDLDVSGSMNSSLDYAEIKWNLPGVSTSSPVPIEPVNYELEWTYVDNYKKNITTGSVTTIAASNVEYDFRNNATRVWLDTNYFRIPIVYQKGYIIYRVRMVRPDSTDYRYPVYGSWGVADKGTGVSSLITAGNCLEISSAHKNDSLNWQYTVSFAEEGKYKHVLSYFDGLLKNRQSITRFNSNPDKLIVTEQVYDFEGRPAISILPTPVSSSGFRYQYNLALNALTNQPYRAADFDTVRTETCPGELPPAPLSSTALASVYYSPYNPDQSGMQKFVPDAGGYPFVQTIYSSGYDKRIDRQGGAGDSLQIGFGHDTQNDYVSADQADLNSLFGVNIGYESYYRKTVTQDPNGQLSLSVQDYKGRPVTTSMIGTGPRPDLHAIIPNDNVPDSTFKMEELLKGRKQAVTGFTKTLERDFYMDVTGYDSIKYVFEFTPMMICTPTDSSFLSVRAHYNYTVIDQCGNTDIYVEDTLGTVGVVKTAAVVSSAEAPRGIFLTKGKHSLRKELTVVTDDIYAAVDSLMLNPPGCFKDEPYFIKESVLSKKFPCPAEDDDDCAKKRKQMIYELFPKAKYGMYSRLPMVRGTDTSIFTIIDSNTGQSYRYQAECLSLPDTVERFGIKYTNIRNLPVDTFLYIFNYEIAESLLPLHPEYCKLLNCFDDNYEDILLSFPSAAAAEANNRFNLDSIIAHDPILPKLSGAPMFYPNARDSLATYRGGLMGIDTIALMQAYCNCGNEEMQKECMTRIFRDEVYSLEFVSPKVKNIYYKNLISAYFGNRDRFKKYMEGAAAPDCGPCASYRMHLIPEPVFPSYFDPNGGIDTSSTSFSATYGTGGSIGFKVADKGFSDTTTTSRDSLKATGDVAAHLHDSSNVEINRTRVDSIIAKLINCTPYANLEKVADTLLVIAERAPVLYGNFTPEQVRYALTINGINLTDLCNPYIITYDYYEANVMPEGVSCKPSEFYEGARDFLNRRPLEALVEATTTGTSSVYSTVIASPNLFEQKIVDQLSNSIQMYATVSADTSLYVLHVFNAVPPPIPTSEDTVLIYLQASHDTSASFNCKNILAYSSPLMTETFNINSVSCITQKLSATLGAGYIVSYAFTADIERRGASSVDYCSLLGWTGSIEMLGGANTLENCVPCTQMMKMYKDFNDSMLTYNVKGIDHPLYDVMLRNFMNEQLRRTFGWNEYKRFIESCSLADSIPLFRYNGYGRATFANDVAANNFIADINVSDTVYMDIFLRYKDVSGVHLLLNFASLPYNKLLTVRNHLSTEYSLEAEINELYNPLAADTFAGRLWVLNGTDFDSVALRGLAGISGKLIITPKKSIDVWNGRGYSPYGSYEILYHSGTTNAEISYGIAEIRRFMQENAMAAFVVNLREPTVDVDFYTSEKQSFLQYVYQFSSLPMGRVLDTLQAPYIEASIYNDRFPSYGHPAAPGDINNLYLNQDTHPGLAKAQTILNAAKTYFSGTNSIFPSSIPGSRVTAISTLSGLNLYNCSDRSYWYRYFGTGDTLFNIFLKMPLYVATADHDEYVYDGVIALPGDGSSRGIKVKMHRGTDTLYANGFCDFTVGTSQVLRDVLLTKAIGSSIPITDTVDNCERTILNSAIREGRDAYALYIDSMKNALKIAFYDYVMNHLGEKLYLGYRDQRFNYTLYSYDRAGNLIRTVSPGGVVKLDDAKLASVDSLRALDSVRADVIPAHTKLSVYEYNTLDKLIRQKTPDGGEVNYFYDALGRVVYSQNDKQKGQGYYTYTLYDAQGRVTETGEVDLSCKNFAFLTDPTTGRVVKKSLPCYYTVGSYSPPHVARIVSYNPYVYLSTLYSQEQQQAYIRDKVRRDVIVTIYDTAAVAMGVIDGQDPQENLRKRVAATKYYEVVSPLDTFYKRYKYATHYSYDIAGNVKTLVHDYPELKEFRQQYKRIDYDYDLASGKVTLLSYNRGWADQYYQRYQYDDDNRITKVETSADGYIWKRDAEYQYYQHGPLARMSLGDLRVQGVDFAYTIQGWLKAINSDVLQPVYDMGQDSFGNNVHAYDAVATSLNYFNGDYRSISGVDVTHTNDPVHSLYNGNISRKSSAILPFRTIMANYTYDQLNRIKYANYDSMSPAVAGAVSLHNMLSYHSRQSYDADGNILSLVRRANKTGAALIMDSLHYYYASMASSNRLKQVTDSAANNYIDDIRQFRDPSLARYQYDGIGNTIKDLVSNQDTIHWNLYNKVTHTENRAGKNRMDFTYNGSGHRVAKQFQQDSDAGNLEKEKTEYYVHDAQGNILAVYNLDRTYSEEEVFLTVAKISASAAMRVTAGTTETYISEMLARSILPDGKFEAALAPFIKAYGDAAPLHTPGYYIDRDSRILDKLMYHDQEWTDSVRAFAISYSYPLTVLSDAMAISYADTNYELGNAIWSTLLYVPDTGIRKDVLARMGGISNGHRLLLEAAARLGLNYDSSLTSTQLADTIVTHSGDVGLLSSVMNRLFMDSSAVSDIDQYFNALVSDDGLFPVVDYYKDRMRNIYQLSLAKYGERGFLKDFFNDYGPAEGHMRSLEGDGFDLYLTDYHSDPLSYLSAMASTMGPEFLDTALAMGVGGGSLESMYRRLFESATDTGMTLLTGGGHGPEAEPWDNVATVLQEERFYLAEHHLYGSSRLGIKSYLPGQVYHYHKQRIHDSAPYTAIDSGILNLRYPWYSGLLKDEIAAVERDAFGHIDSAKLALSHLLGQKQYELTNHLGNVLATISDKRYEREQPQSGGGPGSGDTIKHYKPVIISAYDYYPFGMLMPGRYAAADTSITQVTMTYNTFYEFGTPSGMAMASGMTSGNAQATDVDGALYLTVDSLGDGVAYETGVTPGQYHELQFDAQYIMGAPFRAYVTEQRLDSNQERYQFELCSTFMPVEGKYVVAFTPTMAAVTLHVDYGGTGTAGSSGTGPGSGGPAMAGGGSPGRSAGLVKIDLTPVDRADPTTEVRVVKNVKDLYRFGFNGQEKDNEIYGRGTHYYAPFWGYDSRTGRRWNLDPVDQISISNYAVLSNSPLRNIDPKGDNNYKVDKDGHVKFDKETDDKTDRLISVNSLDDELKYNKKGELKNNSIELEKGILDGRIPSFYNDEDDGGNFKEGSVYNLGDKTETARALFNFFADNTDVEFSILNYQDKSGTQNVIATSHKDDAEYVGANLAMSLATSGDLKVTSMKHTHNHPRKGFTSHGFNNKPSPFDFKFRNELKSKLFDAKFYIREKDVTTEYTDKNEKEDN